MLVFACAGYRGVTVMAYDLSARHVGAIIAKKFAPAICGFISLGLAATTQASAVVVQETYSGQVGCNSSGITACSTVDVLGLFGPAGTDLKGADYTAVYYFDTTLGVFTSASNFNQVHGGPGYSIPSNPSLGASITINNHTFSFDSFWAGNLYGRNDGPGIAGKWSEVDAFAATNLGIYLLNEVQNFHGLIPDSITTAWSYSVQPTDPKYGQFVDGTESLSLTDDFVALDVTPLPATLLLFASGLGALSLLGWRGMRTAGLVTA